MFEFPKSRQNGASEVFAEPVFGRMRRHRRIRQESRKSFQTRACIERGQSEHAASPLLTRKTSLCRLAHSVLRRGGGESPQLKEIVGARTLKQQVLLSSF